jgi:hypothetical protein
MPQPPVPSFVEPSAIPSVDHPALHRMKLQDLELISSNESWAYAHFADKVWLHKYHATMWKMLHVGDMAL